MRDGAEVMRQFCGKREGLAHQAGNALSQDVLEMAPRLVAHRTFAKPLRFVDLLEAIQTLVAETEGRFPP